MPRSSQAAASGRTVREVARERTELSEEDLDRILDPSAITELGLEGRPDSGVEASPPALRAPELA